MNQFRFLSAIILLVLCIHTQNSFSSSGSSGNESTSAYSFAERIWNPASGEHSRWVNAPIKLVSYPITKIQYDIPDLVTSLVTESITRSPLNNAQGAIEEAKQSVVCLKNGVCDIGKGIFNPTNGAIVDGALSICEAGVNVAQAASSLAKTCVSTLGYPLYRLLGGKKSKHFPLNGKRAALVVVDTAVPGAELFLNPYGDQIVRNQLRGITDFYCVQFENYNTGSLFAEGDVSDCLSKMPRDIEFVDIFALTHTGGTSVANRLARSARSRGKTPGLMVSIGCGDPAPNGRNENSMGVIGTNWAVHYYLSNVISKRLRGIPMDVAAKQAYHEGVVINNLNPISLLGKLGMFLLDGSGYSESYPDVSETR